MKGYYRYLIAVFFFLSGCSGLVFEIVWSKALSFSIGNTTYAISTVVAAFMTGLALGSFIAGKFSDRLKNPVKVYAFLELGAGIAGFGALMLFFNITPVFKMVYSAMEFSSGMFLFFRFLTVFIILLVPTVLMGATLPVIISFFSKGSSEYSVRTAFLYGLNTLGAVTGAFVAGFILIPNSGLIQTALAALTVNVLIFISALFIGRKIDKGSEVTIREENIVPFRWNAVLIVISTLFLLSGAVSMIYELSWFRLLSLIFGSSVYSFSLMMLAFLAGIGLGSIAISPFVGRFRDPVLIFSLFEVLMGLTAIAGVHIFNKLPYLYVRMLDLLRSEGSHFFTAQFLISTVIIMIPCLFMGAILPVVVRIFRSSGIGAGENIGRIYFVNTIGTIAGSLLTGFVLIPSIGIHKCLLFGGVLSVAIGVSALFVSIKGRITVRLATAVTACAVCIFMFYKAPSWDAKMMNLGFYNFENIVHSEYGDATSNMRELADNSAILDYQEGINANIMILKTLDNYDISMMLNGKSDASTGMSDMFTQSLSGHIPMFFAENKENVCIIGHGSGITLSSVLKHSPGKVDVVEIEQGVLNLSKYFNYISGDPLSDRAVTTHLEDGRVFLTYTDKVFDVIISEPSNPWMAGTNNLFTAGFYRTVHSRLAPDGVFCQWFPLYKKSYDSISVMINTLRSVFPHTVLFVSKSDDIICIASKNPLTVTEKELEDKFGVPAVMESLASLFIRSPYQLFGFFACSDEGLSGLPDASGLNTDNNSMMEYRAAIEYFRIRRERPMSGDFYSFVAGNLYRQLKTVVSDLKDERLGTICRFSFLLEEFLMQKAATGSWLARRDYFLNGMLKGLEDRPVVREALLDSISVSSRRVEGKAAAFEKLLRANEYIGSDNLRQASAYFEAMLKEFPGFPEGLLQSGKVMYASGRHIDAERYLKSAIPDLMPSDRYEAYYFLALIEKNGGSVEKSLFYCGKARETLPQRHEIYKLEADILTQSGRQSGIRKLAEEGLAWNPGDPELKALLR